MKKSQLKSLIEEIVKEDLYPSIGVELTEDKILQELKESSLELKQVRKQTGLPPFNYKEKRRLMEETKKNKIDIDDEILFSKIKSVIKLLKNSI